jgi:hypothetical protein
MSLAEPGRLSPDAPADWRVAHGYPPLVAMPANLIPGHPRTAHRHLIRERSRTVEPCSSSALSSLGGGSRGGRQEVGEAVEEGVRDFDEPGDDPG